MKTLTSLNIRELYRHLDSSPTGMTDEKAGIRRQAYGYNEVKSAAPEYGFRSVPVITAPYARFSGTSATRVRSDD
jgi:hypothetical protein